MAEEGQMTDWERRALAAEKTATVLANKVKALYNGESASSFQKQIEQAQRRQEIARRKRELSELRSLELKRYSESLEVTVAERTRALTRILDNVTCGFLVVDLNLRVCEGHTQSCLELLACEQIAGRDFVELLGVSDSTQAGWIRLSFEQVVDGMMPDEVCFGQMPQRFALHGRVLRLDARALRDATQKLEGVLFTLTDVTSLEAAEREAHDNQVLIGILKQRDAFGAFICETRASLASAREEIETSPVLVRRVVHTIKGNAASYGLERVVQTIHEIEGQSTIGLADIERIEKAIRAFLAKNYSVLELRYEAERQNVFEVTQASVNALMTIVQAQPAELSSIELWTAHLVLKRAEVVIGPVRALVANLCQRLDKQVDFEIEGGEVLVDERHVGPVFRTLPHLLRNAIDHGIESLDERGAKPGVGRLRLCIEETPVEWLVKVFDDGRGIDAERLSAKASERGLISLAELSSMSLEEKHRLIFLDGLSTALAATEISGRGVGMAAVLDAVRQVGGHIHVQSSLGAGTTIALSIPKPQVLHHVAGRPSFYSLRTTTARISTHPGSLPPV
jgi:two-component system, chemotaxis family, sensor kinase CheA